MEFEQSHVAAGDLGEFVAGVEDSLLLSGQAEHVASADASDHPARVVRCRLPGTAVKPVAQG